MKIHSKDTSFQICIDALYNSIVVQYKNYSIETNHVHNDVTGLISIKYNLLTWNSCIFSLSVEIERLELEVHILISKDMPCQ